MMRKLTAALAAFAVAGGVWFWWSPARVKPHPLAMVSATSQGDASTPTPDSAEIAKKSRAYRLSPAGSMRQRYEQSRDLFALVQSLRPAATAGDLTARVITVDALNECLSVELPKDSQYAAGQEAAHKNLELKTYVNGLIAIQQLRCSRFVKSDIGGVANIRDQYAELAKEGSAKALAMMLTNADLDSIPDTTLTAEVRQILDSGDPDAIGTLSNLMGLRAQGRQNAFGSMSGNVIDQFAWLLAACHMGMACGADSATIRTMCLNGGICGAGSVDQMVSSSFLSPKSYETAVLKSRQIVSSLGSHY